MLTKQEWGEHFPGYEEYCQRAEQIERNANEIERLTTYYNRKQQFPMFNFLKNFLLALVGIACLFFALIWVGYLWVRHTKIQWVRKIKYWQQNRKLLRTDAIAWHDEVML